MYGQNIDYPPVSRKFPAFQVIMPVQGSIPDVGSESDPPVIIQSAYSNVYTTTNASNLAMIFANRVARSTELSSRIPPPNERLNDGKGTMHDIIRSRYLTADFAQTTDDYAESLRREMGIDLLTDPFSVDVLIHTLGGCYLNACVRANILQSSQLCGASTRAYVVDNAGSGGLDLLFNAAERYVLPDSKLFYHPPRNSRKNEAGEEVEIVDPATALYDVRCLLQLLRNNITDTSTSLSCDLINIISKEILRQLGSGSVDFSLAFSGLYLADLGLAKVCPNVSELESVFAARSLVSPLRECKGISDFFNNARLPSCLAERFPRARFNVSPSEVEVTGVTEHADMYDIHRADEFAKRINALPRHSWETSMRIRLRPEFAEEFIARSNKAACPELVRTLHE